jgi:KTSC domain-containing protein
LERVAVQSSNVISVGYDADEGILEVEFSAGSLYEYYRVPREVFDALLASASPGNYLATKVKDVYQYRRIK